MHKLLLTAAALLTAAVSNGASVKWQPSYDSAVGLAKSSHRLVMVDFYTDWCGWCKKLDSDVYSTDLIANEAKGFVPVKVNAEKEGVEQAKKYGVQAYPTILFLRPNGEVAWKIVGYMPASQFAKQMEMASGVETEFPKLKRIFSAKKTDAAVDSKLLAYYSGLNDLKDVQEVVASLEKCGPNSKNEDLASGYNSAGDAYQNAGKNAEAAAAFEKAEALGTPDQVVYARISLAQVYLPQGLKDKAIAVLQKLIGMGPEADGYRKTAEAMLASLKKTH